MDAQEKIYSLIAVTEQHQQLLGELLASVQKERDELREQNEVLRKGITELRVQTDAVRGSASAGAREAVERTMLGVADRASETSRKTAEPLIKHMRAATDEAIKASDNLSEGAKAIGGRLMFYASMGGVMLMISAAAIGYGMGAWSKHELKELRQERTNLEVVVAGLEERGGRLSLANCGKGKQCVEIDASQKPFKSADGKHWALLKYR